MLVYAHRGASGKQPENTPAAFELAIAEKADGIEVDVFQHGDKFIVIHDRWVDRTTSGKGSINNYTLAELKTLDAGNGQQVPTLEEVFTLVNGRCALNLEAKGVSDVGLFSEFIESQISKTQFTDKQILVSSFDHHFLQSFRTQSSRWELGALTASIPLDYAAFASALNAQYVHADVSFINQAFVKDAKQRGLKVNVYTVDQPADIEKLYGWGVDGIFSNYPAEAREVIKSLS